MGVQGFQEYVEKRCPGAAVPVDLLKLARTVARQQQQPPPPPHPHPPPLAPPPPPPARVLIDADSGLQRLYGGYQTDWACGGQWNAMLGYLAALSQACLYQGGLELVVMFNGTLGKERWPEWARRAQGERQTAQLIVNHIANKGTPPPRAWFLPPACLSHCIRLAMVRFRVRVVQSLEDHHQEVISFYRDYGFQGLIAHDSEYALCNIPAYFSSHALKLSWNGKNLTTNQYLMAEVAKQLGLKPSQFPTFAALLGNHILPDEDLAAFHWSLLGPEHPLASLKVRAHQLVLPPCEVVIKAVSEYVAAIKDLNNLEAIARDVFRQSQSRTEDKVERFKKAVEYFSAASKPRPLAMGPSPFIFSGFGPGQFGGPAPPHGHIGTLQPGKSLFVAPNMSGKLPYHGGSFLSGPHPNPALMFSHPSSAPGGHLPVQECNDGLSKIPFTEWSAPYDNTAGRISGSTMANTSSGNMGNKYPNHHLATKPSPSSGPASSPSSSSDGEDHNSAGVNHIPDKSQSKGGWDDSGSDRGKVSGSSECHHGNGSPQIPSLLSMATRNHMDITTPPLPEVGAEVLRVAEHRHRRGLMYPYIYHVLTKGEIKIAVCIEDECNPDLPPAAALFRSARQYVYGVLFSLAETQRRMERLSLRKRVPLDVPPVFIKEWSASKAKSPLTPELVPALTFREWTCPNLKKLWLGRAVEDKNRRMRAFLACLKSDTPGMLNPSNVPTHLLLMCCVLRYMMQWPGGRILQRHELDAFLAQAVSSQLYELDQLQELKIDKLDSRGVQLAALFMSGVDTALFVNDACGQPIPWEHCCPWIYFDGKLFQSKLSRASRERLPLLELCDGQVEQAAKVEKMRQAILEGLNLNRQPPPPPPLPPPAFMPTMVPPFYPVPLYPRPLSNVTPNHQRSRAFPGVQAIPPQGGKLEIAGMVVGQWAGNKPIRGRGGFNMQVVSVGGGKGRGKDMTGKSRGSKKVPTVRAQLGSPGPSNGTPKNTDGSKGRSSTDGIQQLNGNTTLATVPPAVTEEESPQSHPHNRALTAKDSEVGADGPSNEGDLSDCQDSRLGGAKMALQKEE